MPRDQMEQYYQNAIKACPWHYGAHYQKCIFLEPKWYGSIDEMNAFAEECLAQSAQYPSLGLIRAYAYDEERRYNDHENFAGMDDAWPVIETVYTRFFEKFPDENSWRYLYAYYAYLCAKYDVACKQFQTIGDQWMDDTRWPYFDSYNAARAATYYAIGVNLEFQEKRHEESLNYLRAAVAYRPTANAYYSLGIADWNLGYEQRDVSLLRKAEEALTKAVQMEPKHSQAADQLGKLQAQLSRL